MANFTKSTQLRMESTLFDKLKFIASINRRSFNAQVEFLADQCVREYESTNGPINLDSFDPDIRFRSSPRSS